LTISYTALIPTHSSFRRWGKKDQTQLSGGRYIVFIAGGVGYSELRVAYDQMQHNTKEIIIGGSNIISPEDFIDHVAELDNGRRI
jgi:hypothetical protein